MPKPNAPTKCPVCTRETVYPPRLMPDRQAALRTALAMHNGTALTLIRREMADAEERAANLDVSRYPGVPVSDVPRRAWRLAECLLTLRAVLDANGKTPDSLPTTEEIDAEAGRILVRAYLRDGYTTDGVASVVRVAAHVARQIGEELAKIEADLTGLAGNVARPDSHLTPYLDDLGELLATKEYLKGLRSVILAALEAEPGHRARLVADAVDAAGGADEVAAGVRESLLSRGEFDQLNPAITETQAAIDRAEDAVARLAPPPGVPPGRMLKEAEAKLKALRSQLKAERTNADRAAMDQITTLVGRAASGDGEATEALVGYVRRTPAAFAPGLAEALANAPLAAVTEAGLSAFGMALIQRGNEWQHNT